MNNINFYSSSFFFFVLNLFYSYESFWKSLTFAYTTVSFFLKDPSDKRQIICDEKLKELFNLDTFCGFTVSKHLTAHFIKAEQ